MHVSCQFIADTDQAFSCRPLAPKKLAQLAKQARCRLAPSTRKDYDDIINVFGVSTCGSLGREGATAYKCMGLTWACTYTAKSAAVPY